MSAGVLSRIGGALNSPQNAGLLGLAAGLGEASAPHRLPVPITAAIAQGLQGAQQMRAASLQNALQQAVLPLKQGITSEFQRAMSGKRLVPKVVNYPDDGKQSPAEKLRQASSPLAKVKAARQKDLATSLLLNLMGAPTAAGQVFPSDPVLQGGLARIKALNTIQKVKGGEGLAFPGQPNLNFIPHTVPGQTVTPKGGVGLAPGAVRSLLALGTLNPAIRNIFTPGPPQVGLSGPIPQSRAQALGTPGNLPAALALARGIANGQGRPPLGVPPGIPSQGGVPPQLLQRGAVPSSAPPVLNALEAGLQRGQGGPTNKIGLSPSQVSLEQGEAKKTEAIINEGTESQIALANAAELSADLQRFATGPGTDVLLKIKSAFSGIARVFGIPPPKIGDITSANVLNKVAINWASSIVGSMGQKAEGAFSTVLHAVPNIANTGMANQFVIGAISAAARYRFARSVYAQKWMTAHNGNAVVAGKGTMSGYWNQHAPFMTFFMDSLPPPAQQEILQYARKNATLRAQLKQAANAYPMLHQGGYL